MYTDKRSMSSVSVCGYVLSGLRWLSGGPGTLQPPASPDHCYKSPPSLSAVESTRALPPGNRVYKSPSSLQESLQEPSLPTGEYKSSPSLHSVKGHTCSHQDKSFPRSSWPNTPPGPRTTVMKTRKNIMKQKFVNTRRCTDVHK